MENSSAAEVIEKCLAEAALLQPAADLLNELSVTVELTYGDPTSNSALRIDLDGNTAIGRITWWSDGSSHLEALRISDGATLFSSHGTAATASDAAGQLRELAHVVAGLPSNSSFKPSPLRGPA